MSMKKFFEDPYNLAYLACAVAIIMPIVMILL